jgi:hypothetical protein
MRSGPAVSRSKKSQDPHVKKESKNSYNTGGYLLLRLLKLANDIITRDAHHCVTR